MRYITHSLDNTKKIAHMLFSQALHPFFLLYGDLGVGKTQFAKYIGNMIGVSETEIISPTFSYIREYQGENDTSFFHFDLYRCDEERNADILIKEYMEHFSTAVVCIEWSERLSVDFTEYLCSLGFQKLYFSCDNTQRFIELLS